MLIKVIRYDTGKQKHTRMARLERRKRKNISKNAGRNDRSKLQTPNKVEMIPIAARAANEIIPVLVTRR